MKFYLLKYKASDTSGIIPMVTYDDKQVDADYYKLLITDTSFWNPHEPAFLWLYDDLSITDFNNDFLPWRGSEPSANILVCSNKGKKALARSLHLPTHRFYDAKIRINKQYKDFFIFHYLQNIFTSIDFSRSIFCLQQYGQAHSIAHVFSAGEIQNKEQITSVTKENIKNKLWVQPLRLVFNDMPPYDIWSLYGQHIISAKAMLLFEEAGITGIDMIPLEETEWKNLEIVMKPTDTITVSK